jgi:DNA-binding transcriptional regulator YdaS (Cro superfamily)
MSPHEAIQHFGSQSALASALGVTQPTVSGWNTEGRIPFTRQFQLQVLTAGKLKADESKPQ